MLSPHAQGSMLVSHGSPQLSATTNASSSTYHVSRSRRVSRFRTAVLADLFKGSDGLFDGQGCRLGWKLELVRFFMIENRQVVKTPRTEETAFEFLWPQLNVSSFALMVCNNLIGMLALGVLTTETLVMAMMNPRQSSPNTTSITFPSYSDR